MCQQFLDVLRNLLDKTKLHSMYVTRRSFLKKLFNLKSCLVFLILLDNERKHFGNLVKKSRRTGQNFILRVQKDVLSESKLKKSNVSSFFIGVEIFFIKGVKISLYLSRRSSSGIFFLKMFSWKYLNLGPKISGLSGNIFSKTHCFEFEKILLMKIFRTLWDQFSVFWQKV